MPESITERYPQCWISEDHYTTKIVTEYLWFWLAWLVSFLTALAYNFSWRINKRLPVGFLWIGFPMKGRRLLRVGLVSMDTRDPGRHGRVVRSFSLFEITSPQRTIRVMLPIPIQYLEREWNDARAWDDVRPVNQGQSLKLLL